MMREKRQNRLTDEFRDLSARYLERESNRKSLITITRAELLGEGKTLRCMISIFPQSEEKVALEFAKRKAPDLREYLSKETKTRFVPKITFELDLGEKNRQRIEELLKK